MLKLSAHFERVISYILLAAGMVFICFQTLELLWELSKSIFARLQESGLNYNPEYSKNGVVLFFNVLLALEILETIKVFEKSHEIKIRIILIVCLIAVSRKILLLDTHESDPTAELALAALIIAFSLGYYLVNKQHPPTKSQEEK